MSRDLDVVLMGASGFVGQLVAEQLSLNAPEGLRVALAGRNPVKLRKLRSALPERAQDWPICEVDSADADGLAKLAASATVVASTVGPYLRLGVPLVAACAGAGTHYVDLAGELLFLRHCIDRFHDVAAESGARIVHSCGLDSVPSDLGVLVLAGELGELSEVTLVLRSAAGGVSGGTVASLWEQLAVLRSDPGARRIAADPYALSPDRAAEPDLGPQPDAFIPRNDPQLGWLAPWVMAGFNSRVVRRSNALLGWSYGRQLRYQEAVGTGRGWRSAATAGGIGVGMAAFGAATGFGPTRSAVALALPRPGQGPDARTRHRGHFRLELHGRSPQGRRAVVNVAAKGDPGYQATSLMMAQAALCAAVDAPAGLLPPAAGVLTPATAFGARLVDRLRAAGMVLSASS